MVCVRKNDGSLRLCIDYRKLNNKTILDRQQVPKVQYMLGCTGDNSSSLASIWVRHTTKDILTQIQESIHRFLLPGRFTSTFKYL